jgi:hypothetical protein
MSNDLMSTNGFNADSIYFDVKRFEHTQSIAKLLSGSDTIPLYYRGNVPNCFIAVATAMRMKVDPYLYMQKSAIINGKPTVEAQLLIAALNQSGLIKGRVEYAYSGSGEGRACTASAEDVATGKKYTYTLTLKDALQVGNASRNPNWRAIPDLMLAYRAATYLIRTCFPEAGMGLSTKDEIEDVFGNIQDITPSRTYNSKSSTTSTLAETLNAEFLDKNIIEEVQIDEILENKEIKLTNCEDNDSIDLLRSQT